MMKNHSVLGVRFLSELISVLVWF